jgi:cell division septum initiation protein DivIVA
MSARDLSADLEPSLPEFPIVLRGYDRPSVEQYIAELHQRLAETDERRRRAESQPSSRAYQEVGPRVAEIFALAEAEAAEIISGAEREVQDTLAGARAEAEAMIAAARTEAQAQTARQQRDWEALLAAYEADRDRIRAEVDALNRQKTTVLGELRRLRDALGQAPGLVEALAPLAPSAALGVDDELITRRHEIPVAADAATRGADRGVPAADEDEVETRVLPVSGRPDSGATRRSGRRRPEAGARAEDREKDDEFLDVPGLAAAPILEDEPEFEDDPDAFSPRPPVEDEPEFDDPGPGKEPEPTQAYTIAEQAELGDEH